MSSAGTCHAPQTTATVAYPSLTAARIARRMCASRRCSPSDGTVPARTAAIASATASNATRPSPRCSTTSSHHRSASGSPAAAANAPKGSTGAPSVSAISSSPASSAAPVSVLASGRSIARTSTPRALAHATACHSGLNDASGANAARCGWSTTWPSSATEGRAVHRRSTPAPLSSRPAPRRARCRAAARRTPSRPTAPNRDRGAGCRAGAPPRACPSVQRAAGVVEVVPAVAVAHDRLEVLAPGDGVVHRIADDRADDAGRDVVGARACRRRSGRPATARW